MLVVQNHGTLEIKSTVPDLIVHEHQGDATPRQAEGQLGQRVDEAEACLPDPSVQVRDRESEMKGYLLKIRCFFARAKF